MTLARATVLVGRNMLVALGQTGATGVTGRTGIDAKILGMGTWNLDLGAVATIPDTEFGDAGTKKEVGLRDYGGCSFSGNYDKGDTGGQGALISAYNAFESVQNLRLYVDEDSYWGPDLATDSTSGVLITQCVISGPQAALGTIAFTGVNKGPMKLFAS